MNKFNVVCILACFFSSGTLLADSAQQGLQIVQEMDKRDTGWGDNQADLQMVLKNRHGDEHTRTLVLKTLEIAGDGDKSLSIFDNPRDVKGTAFLSYTHALEADEQWLYLPALKRVKRISSSNKSGPFLGSEFAFEDLSSFEVKKYTYQYVQDEQVEGIDCFIVESTPQYEHSGYTRLLLAVDKQRYIPIKIDYYDRKNVLLKTQNFRHYQQYLEQFWRADEMTMANHHTGKSTQLIWKNHRFKKGLTDRDFDRNTLKRAR